MRMLAKRRKASDIRVRFSKSLASLRQRPIQANVRSTIHRFGSTTKPFAWSDRLTICSRLRQGSRHHSWRAEVERVMSRARR